MLKQCTKCKKNRSKQKFFTERSRVCVDCHSHSRKNMKKYWRDYYNRPENKEKKKAWNKKYRKNSNQSDPFISKIENGSRAINQKEADGIINKYSRLIQLYKKRIGFLNHFFSDKNEQ